MSFATPSGRAGTRLLAACALALAASLLPIAAAAPSVPASGIILNHKVKVEGLGLTCDLCHAPSETKPGLMAFPTMDSCAACHAEETDMSLGIESCAKCHTREDYSSSVRKDRVLMPGIAFDHGRHTAAKVDCLSCHVVFDKVGVKGDEMLPKMASCMTCHKERRVAKGTDCATCHSDRAIAGKAPANHGALWLQNHGKGLAKKTVETSCTLCHSPSNGLDCASCHQREAPKNHTSAWTMRSHGQTARTNRDSCSTCHAESQCIDCHTTQKPSTHVGSWGSPGDRHCYSCHLTGSDYGSGSLGSSCVLCHANAEVQASHKSVPRLAAQGHVTGATCSACHTPTSVTPPHPYPTGASQNAQCASCHLYQ